jgi:hypothetical protein
MSASSKTEKKNSLLVSGPFVGLDRTQNSRRLKPAEAYDAYNVDLDRATIRGREGFDAGFTAPNGEPVDSQFDYRQLDGTRVHLVKAGGQLYSLSGGAFSIVGSNVLESDNLAQFIVVGGKCYIAHGGTPKVTDGTSLYDWRIEGPDYTPDVTGTSGGLLTGVYDYKITFYSSTWGIESPASPPTNEADTATPGIKTSAIELVDQWVELSNLPTSSDTRVDKIRIYRRKLSASESDWYFVEEIPMLAGGWVDQTPDADREVAIAPLTYTDEYPQARLTAHNLGVTYLAGIEGDPSSLWYTREGSMAVFDRLILDDDGGEITGLLSFQGQLVVFTSRSIWLLSGVPPTSHALRRLVRDRGCLAPFSIVPVDSMVYFLSENGVFAWTGSGVMEVSRPSKPLWLDRNHSVDWKIKGVHDITSSSVWWSYAASGETTTSSILVYFYRNSAVVGSPSWARWNIPGAVGFEQITDSTTNTRRVSVGFSDGRIATYGTATDDNGTEIESWWETGDEDANSPTVKKHWGVLSIETDSADAGITDVEAALEGSGVFNPIGVPTETRDNFRRFRIGMHSAQLALRIAWTGDAELVSWAVQVDRSTRT